MGTQTTAAIAAFATLTFTLPALAVAGPPPAKTSCPIEIRKFNVTPSIPDPERGRHPGSIAITFRNVRTVAATHVTFDLYRKKKFVRSVTTNGVFSPGIDIFKQFVDTSNVVIVRAVVAKADFADGTVCHNRESSGAVITQRKRGA